MQNIVLYTATEIFRNLLYFFGILTLENCFGAFTLYFGRSEEPSLHLFHTHFRGNIFTSISPRQLIVFESGYKTTKFHLNFQRTAKICLKNFYPHFNAKKYWGGTSIAFLSIYVLYRRDEQKRKTIQNDCVLQFYNEWILE